MQTDTQAPTVNPSALRVLREVSDAIERVRHFLGETHPDYLAMISSWVRATGQTFNLIESGGSLSRDDNASLYLVTSYGMHAGVIFFRNRRYDSVTTYGDGWPQAQVCIAHGQPWNPETERWCVGLTEPIEESRNLCMARTIPVPGEWSIHS